MIENIPTAEYRSESTESLIRRAEQILGGVPILDLTNPQYPTYIPAGGHTWAQIRSLGSSCYSIKIKNVVSVTDSSIVVCTDTPTGTCGAIPGTCGGLGATTPDKYYNFVATVSALVAQIGVQITFKYVQNGLPSTQVVTTNLSAGSNTVYAFTTNQTYTPGTELVLYGAEATSY